jgi:KDO2-lipid IV(A) lauroyltransferase
MSRLIFGWLTAGIASLPPWLGYALADLATRIHWLAFPGRRHAVLANLAVILPRASRADRGRVARRMMRSYNRMMYEFFRLPHLSREELLGAVEVVGKEHLDQGIARGRGVILAATHIGNWELAGVMVAQWGYALHAVAGVQLGRWLTGAVRDTKTELSITTIAPEDGFRKIMRALEHNDPVALMVDGNLYAHGHTVEWFGRATPFPAGPGVLAQRTGALILCGYCERTTPGRFRIVIEPPLDPAAFATTAELHQAVATIAERHIRAHIDQWCIFRPMWAEPADQPAVAPAGEGAAARSAAGDRRGP